MKYQPHYSLLSVALLLQVFAITAQELTALPFAAQHALKQYVKARFDCDTVMVYDPQTDIPEKQMAYWHKALASVDHQYNSICQWDINNDGIDDYAITIAFGKQVSRYPKPSACILLESAEGTGYRAVGNAALECVDEFWPPFVYINKQREAVMVRVKKNNDCTLQYHQDILSLNNGFIYNAKAYNNSNQIDQIEYNMESIWRTSEKTKLVLKSGVRPYLVIRNPNASLTAKPEEKRRIDSLPYSRRQMVWRETLMDLLVHLPLDSTQLTYHDNCVKDASSLVLIIQYTNGTRTTIVGNGYNADPTLASCVALLYNIQSAPYNEHAIIKTVPGNLP